jgi:hypothetical protein
MLDAMPQVGAGGAALHPVKDLFPTRSKRWVADTCRARRFPARKIGKVWYARPCDVERFMRGETPGQAALEIARINGDYVPPSGDS